MRDTELTPIQQAEAEVLARLLQLYAYDFSEVTGADVDAGGSFTVPSAERFVREPHYRPFFIHERGALAGFAIVSEHSRLWPDNAATDMAEFFVLRRHRRHGVGERAAVQVFDRFPGRWEVRQLWANVAATAFWRAVIARYSGDRFEQVTHDTLWPGPVQIFVSEP